MSPCATSTGDRFCQKSDTFGRFDCDTAVDVNGRCAVRQLANSLNIDRVDDDANRPLGA